MYDKLHLKGSYVKNTEVTNLKFSLIKCTNTTSNGHGCQSPEKIQDFMDSIIIEMRIDGYKVANTKNIHN